MNNIKCYDLDGNIIDTFYQWDINQKIIVESSNFNFNVTANTAPPVVHFGNDSMNYSISVQSSIENQKIVVDVPNCILMTSLPIDISFYFSSEVDITSKRTLLTARIPVRKQNQPSSYIYTENIKNYTFDDLIQNMMDVNNKLDFAAVSELKNYLGI